MLHLCLSLDITFHVKIYNLWHEIRLQNPLSSNMSALAKCIYMTGIQWETNVQGHVKN